MRDFLLDEITGDLDLSSGDIRFADGVTAIAQLIGTRFRFNRGEWFLDLRVGAPLLGGDGTIFGASRADLETVRSICTQIIEGTPGVARLDKLNLDLDSNRGLTVKFECTTESGETIAGTETLIFEAI